MFERFLDDPSVNPTLKTGMYIVNEVSKWVSSWFGSKLYMNFHYKSGIDDNDEDSIIPSDELVKSKDELHKGIKAFEGSSPEEALTHNEEIAAAAKAGFTPLSFHGPHGCGIEYVTPVGDQANFADKLGNHQKVIGEAPSSEG